MLVPIGIAAVLALSPLLARAAEEAFDKRFLRDAYQNLAVENEITRLAREHSRSEGVKHYAELQIGGNRKMMEEVADLAKDHDVKLSDEMSEKQRDALEHLRKLDGQDFDIQYMSMEREDQKSLVDTFDRASKECKDQNVREFARHKLAPLQEHLANAEELYRKIKNKER